MKKRQIRNWNAANKVRLFAILVLAIPVIAVTACAPQPADCAREETFCVGLVTAYESIEDHSLNQAAWKTLQNIETQAQIARLDNIESIDPRDWEKNIFFFADNGYDVIVTVGTNLGEATIKVAAEHPEVSFVGVDQEFAEDYENIATIAFPQDQAGFLAGMLAAMVSKAGKVGAICETSGIDEVWQYCEGFRAGAIYEKDDIEVLVEFRDNGDRDKIFNDPEWGRQSLLDLAGKGVDIVTGFGGNTAQGAFLAAPEKGVFVIGSEEDLYERLPDIQEVVITSIINDPGTAVASLVVMASQGQASFGSHEGNLTLAPFRTPLLTTAEIQSNMEDALRKIESGEIEIKLPEKK
jgi:basic membrane protein A